MSTVHRFGLTRLDKDDADGAASRCNIIFVHGLRGHPQHTWTEDANETSSARHLSLGSRAPIAPAATADSRPRKPGFWPRDLLAADLPDARIWTYGYDADVIDARPGTNNSTNKNSLLKHGQDLASMLRRDVVDENPIIFVAHSLGGLVVKDALCRSDVLQRRTTGIIFLGTPHQARSAADWAKIASNIAAVTPRSPPAASAGTFMLGHLVVDGVHRRFLAIATRRNISVHSFLERRGIAGMRRGRGKVVDDFSATLGLPGEGAESIDADHLQLARCTGRGDARYTAILGVLERFSRQAIADSLAHRQLTPVPPASESAPLPTETASPMAAFRDSVKPPLTRPASRADFEIAIVCALPIECDAVLALFDRRWDKESPRYGRVPGDRNIYSTGALGRHNVVLVHMPGMGKSSAAAAASSCRVSFPDVKLALLVGVCGVLPTSPDGKEDIFLGDVAVSEGVIQYAFGRRLPGQFRRKCAVLDALPRPNPEIRGLLSKLKGVEARQMLADKTADSLGDFQRQNKLGAAYPGVQHDSLFKAKYSHLRDGKTCDECGCSRGQIMRRRRVSGVPQPSVHFGLFASGDTVMKSGEYRDRIATEEKVVAFEMEAAGLWEAFPCVVIKGACDYADSHKMKAWQQYAAATAAACAKAFLDHWEGSDAGMAFSSLDAGAHSGRRFEVPFRENQKFVGREDTLRDLKERLLNDNIPHRLALVGLGGVGKTQVALQIAYWVKEHTPDWSVFWLPALSMAAFEQACGEMVRRLGLEGLDEEDPKDVFRRHLESARSGRWLLIVDNADDMKIVFGDTDSPGFQRHLPESPYGRVVFTTRSTDVALAVADDNVMELGEMSEREAGDFLAKLLSKEKLEDDESAAALLRELTYLPLAISQAAAYVKRNKISLFRYLSLLRNTQTEAIALLRRELPDLNRYQESRHAVAATWLVSFEQIRRDDRPAADLLSFISQIEPRAIPRSMLPMRETEEELVQALGTLKGYAFLQAREDEKTFDMHSLVHLATRSWIGAQAGAQKVRDAALAHLVGVFKTDDWEHRATWREYMPHVLRAIRVDGSEADWGEDGCKLGFWAGRCLMVEGRIGDAVELLERLVAMQETKLAEYHPSRLASQHALAEAYQANGQVKEAVELLERVVAVRETTLAEDHPDRLASQHALALAYEADGQVKEAIELLEHVVAASTRTLAKDHPDRLASQHELAIAYQANSQVKEATELLQHVVAVQETTLAEGHPSRLTSQHALAEAYQANSQVKEATELLQHVVAVRETTLVEDHPSRLTSQHALARAFRANSQVKEAVELLEHVVAVESRTMAEDHPSRLTSQYALAGAYRANGHVKEAVELLEHVVAVEARTLAEDHSDRLASQHALAIAYQANSQVKEATEMLQHVVAIKAMFMSPSHPSRIVSEDMLAWIQSEGAE